jgi:hypothetical protein
LPQAPSPLFQNQNASALCPHSLDVISNAQWQCRGQATRLTARQACAAPSWSLQARKALRSRYWGRGRGCFRARRPKRCRKKMISDGFDVGELEFGLQSESWIRPRNPAKRLMQASTSGHLFFSGRCARRTKASKQASKQRRQGKVSTAVAQDSHKDKFDRAEAARRAAAGQQQGRGSTRACKKRASLIKQK